MENFVIAESNFAVAIRKVEEHIKDGWSVAPFVERQYPFFDGIVFRIFMQREGDHKAAPKQRRSRKTEDVAEQAVEE